MKEQYLNSKLYADLFQKGGSGLVAAYVLLLNGRRGYHCYLPYKNLNNKITKGKRLISKQSGISLTALNKYLPMLVELELGWGMICGGYFMVGSKKINERYKSRKKVSIKLEENLQKTIANVEFVKLQSNAYKQGYMIDKKTALNKTIGRSNKGLPVTAKEAKALKNALKSGKIDISNLKKVETIVLSNKGISNIIKGGDTDQGHKATVSGSYYRNLYKQRGLMVSRQRFKSVWSEKISYNRYLQMKEYFNEQYGFVTYRKGRVVTPVVSEVMFPTSKFINSDLYNTQYIKEIVRSEETPPAVC